jgi:hypothetical protein
LAKKLSALIVGLPDRKIGSKKAEREVDRTIDEIDVPEPTKYIAKRFVWRFFYYYGAEISAVESNEPSKKKIGSSTVLPFPKVGPKSEEEEEPDENKKRKRESKGERALREGIKRIKIEGMEGRDRIKEEYDSELALVVARIPPEVWWKIFGYLSRMAIGPSPTDEDREILNLMNLQDMLTVSKAWNSLLPEAIYYTVPGLVYRNMVFGSYVDRNIKGGIKKLNLADHLQIVTKGDWYDNLPSDFLENPEDTEDGPTIIEYMLDVSDAFTQLEDLSFVYQSFGPEVGGQLLLTHIHQTWKFNLDFLGKHGEHLKRLEIRDLTEDLQPSLTERLVNLTSLSLNEWSGISRESNATVYLSHSPLDRSEVETNAFTPMDDALESLKRLKRLKIVDLPSVTLPGLLRLTNLTKLVHEGKRCDNPIVKLTGDHAYKLSHMTSLTKLTLNDSFVANVAVLPANSTFPVVFDDSVHYDPMKDLKNMSSSFEALKIYGTFSEIVLDELPHGLRDLDLSNAKGMFRFFDPMRRGKMNVLASLTKLNVTHLVCEGFTYEEVAKASVLSLEEGQEASAEMLAQANFKATIAKNATHRNAMTLSEIAPNIEELLAWDEFDLTSLSDEVAKKMRSITCATFKDRGFRIPVPPLELTRFENLQALELGGYFFPTESCVTTFASTLTKLIVLYELPTSEDSTPKNILDVLLHEVEGDRSFKLFTGLKSLTLTGIGIELDDVFELTNLTELNLDRYATNAVYFNRDNHSKLGNLANLNKLTLKQELIGKSDVTSLTNLTLLDIDYKVWGEFFGDDEENLPDFFANDPINEEVVDFLPNLKTLEVGEIEIFSDLT